VSRRLLRGVAVALALGGVASGCSLPGAVKGPLKLTVEFNDVGDLVVNHSVQVADVRVGSVTKIELTKDYKAKVTLELKNVDLAADTIAELRTTSLLGEKFISLRPCVPATDGAVCAGGTGKLKSGDAIPRNRTKEAPELEFVAEQAAQLLGGVAVNDIATLVQTGSVAFGGRGPELRGLLEDLSVISGTLADQANNITTIIDGLDKATTALATNDPALDQLLVNLSATVKVLADNRDQAVSTLQALTRLMQDEDNLVFEPYIDTVNRQVRQLDAILQEVTQGRQEVGLLVDWLEKFVYKVPQGIVSNPNDPNGTAFAQVYGWFVACPGDGC
jgi:phospholipid/cholesterol/gamma-HCH transport system substrate-binding protein